MIMRSFILSSLISAGLAAATVSDDFTDGVITLAGEKTLWAVNVDPQVSVTEVDGSAVLTASGKSYVEANLVGKETWPELDFLAAPVRISLRGLAFSQNDLKPEQVAMRVGLCSEPKRLFYNTEDAIVLRVDGSGAWRLGFKLDKPNANPDATVSVRSGRWTAVPERIDLVLGAERWALAATIGGAVETIDGSWPAEQAPTRAAWGPASALRLHAQIAAKEVAADASTTLRVGQIVAGADEEAKR